jgi:hypothetical protein
MQKWDDFHEILEKFRKIYLVIIYDNHLSFQIRISLVSFAGTFRLRFRSVCFSRTFRIFLRFGFGYNDPFCFVFIWVTVR